MNDHLWFGNINEINLNKGFNMQSIPIFFTHLLVATFLSFFNHSKANFRGCWMNVANKLDIDDIVQRCSSCPTEISASELEILRKFVLSVYEKNLSAERR